jgi:hypothetical protein
MADEDLTDLGAYIEAARGGMSKREAARRAGISEGRWRQVVTGKQKAGGGVVVPANPRRETVIAMARAVGADANEALRRAGMSPSQAETFWRVPDAPVEISAVAEAILHDTELIEEARQHLLRQYELLKRVAPEKVSDHPAKQQPRRPETPVVQKPLRAAARRGKPDKS